MFIGYLIVVAALLVRFVSSRRLVARLWRDAAPASNPQLATELAGMARELKFSRPVELRIARGGTMPMTWGSLSPKILFPAEALSWPSNRRRLVLTHELAHVARFDSFSLTVASLACIIWWFHPGVWLVARRLRLEQELAADDRVLMMGAPARDYAVSLLDLARRLGDGARPTHAAAMAGMCQLERRVLSMTGPASRDRPGVAFLAAAAFSASVLLLAIAAGVPVSSGSLVPDRSLADADAVMSSAAAEPIEGAAESPAQRPTASADHPSSGRASHVTVGTGGGAGFLPPAGMSEPAGTEQLASAPTPAQTEQADGQAAPFPNSASEVAPPASVYGPVLQRSTAAQDDLDPRIPKAFRRSESASTANRDHAPPNTDTATIARGGIAHGVSAVILGSLLRPPV